MGITISELTESDKIELAARFQAADAIVEAWRSGSHLTREPRDLSVLQAIIDDPKGREAVQGATEEFGIAFGELLLALEAKSSFRLPIGWAVVFGDEYGRRFVVKHSQFDAFITIQIALENKLESGGSFKVAALMSHLVSILEEEIEKGTVRRSDQP